MNRRNARTGEPGLSRRGFLRGGAQTGAAVALSLFGQAVAAPPANALGGADAFGPLQPADGNGLRLPPGFSSRVVAVTGLAVGTTTHSWHPEPDGGATFSAPDGGWVYVSNSEVASGGVGAIRFGPGRLFDPVGHVAELRGRPDFLGHLAFLRRVGRRSGLRV